MKRYSPVRYVHHDVSTNENTGNQQMAIELVTTGPGRGDEPRTEGETVFKFNALTEKTIPYVSKELRALGMSNTDFLDPEGLGGTDAELVEHWEEYNGKWRWKAKYINVPRQKNSRESETVSDDLRALLMEALENEPTIEPSSDW